MLRVDARRVSDTTETNSNTNIKEKKGGDIHKFIEAKQDFFFASMKWRQKKKKCFISPLKPHSCDCRGTSVGLNSSNYPRHDCLGQICNAENTNLQSHCWGNFFSALCVGEETVNSGFLFARLWKSCGWLADIWRPVGDSLLGLCVEKKKEQIWNIIGWTICVSRSERPVWCFSVWWNR